MNSGKEKCKGCGELEGLYDSGFCDFCIADEEQQACIEAARAGDEHAPREGSLYDNAYTARVLDAWDRGQL